MALTRKDADKLYTYNKWYIDRLEDADDSIYNIDTDTSDENLSRDYLLDRIDKQASIQEHNFKIFSGYSQYDGED